FDCSRALYNVALSLLVLRFPPQPISPPFPYTTLFRSVDTMARFGGDEFMLLLEEVDNQQTVLQIADRIQECLKDPFELSGREIRVGSSVGITLGDAHYLDPDDVLRDADLALYEAKRRGKAQYVIFDSKMRNQRMARLHLEAELRQA